MKLILGCISIGGVSGVPNLAAKTREFVTSRSALGYPSPPPFPPFLLPLPVLLGLALEDFFIGAFHDQRLMVTPPVIGRIAIGKVVERNGKRLPEKDNKFTITTQVQARRQ